MSTDSQYSVKHARLIEGIRRLHLLERQAWREHAPVHFLRRHVDAAP